MNTKLLLDWERSSSDVIVAMVLKDSTFESETGLNFYYEIHILKDFCSLHNLKFFLVYYLMYMYNSLSISPYIVVCLGVHFAYLLARCLVYFSGVLSSTKFFCTFSFT